MDSVGNSTTATGTLAVTVRQETYINVTFSNVPWQVSLSANPFVSSITPNLNGSVVVLGHAPYQYYVDSVSLPVSLTGLVVISPTQRVLAINCSSIANTTYVPDADASLANSSSFAVPSVLPSSLIPGTYTIPVKLRVVDNDSLASSQTVNVTLTITS